MTASLRADRRAGRCIVDVLPGQLQTFGDAAHKLWASAGEDNGDAHRKRQVMGREVVVAITGGRVDLGPSEQIFYGEFDGRRPKRVLVKIIGE